MAEYLSKRKLYEKIDTIRGLFGIPVGRFHLNMKSILNPYSGVNIGAKDFRTRGLRGMARLATAQDECDVILLNSCRTELEQNFDCCHEMVHLFVDRDENRPAFTCFDKVPDKQDRFVEWHANEGGAQFLVPYQTFIPVFTGAYEKLQRSHDFDLYGYLSDLYNVSTMVIGIRMESLAYEIDQYSQGVMLENLDICSRTQLNRMGITPTNYRALCAFPLDWDSKIWA